MLIMKIFISSFKSKSKLFRCFYVTSSEIVTHNRASLKGKFLLDLFICLCSLVRLCLFVCMIKSNYRFKLWRCDPFAYFIYSHKSHYDLALVIVAIGFVTYLITVKCAIYCIPSQSSTWHFFYRLIVANQDWYYQCRRDQSELSEIIKRRKTLLKLKYGKYLFWFPQIVQRAVLWSVVRLTLFGTLEDVDKKRFFCYRNVIFEDMTRELETRIVLMLILCDWYCLVIQIGFSSIFIFTINFIYPTILSPYEWYYSLMYLSDCALFYHCMIQLLQSGLFLSNHILIVNFFYCSQLKFVYRSIKNRLNSRQLLLCVNHLLKSHTRICCLVQSSNRDLFGLVLAVFLFIQIPINIDMLRRMYFKQKILLLHQLALLIVVFSIQLFGLFAILSPMASVNQTLHAPVRVIHTVQKAISRKWIVSKLRLDHLFYRLTRGPKYGITVGPLDAVTHRAMFEILIVYIGFVMFVFGFHIGMNVISEKE